MITLEAVKDWIKSLGVGEFFYMGKLDNKKEKAVGVYQRPSNNPLIIPLGGLDNKSYDIKQVSVLVHWTKDAAETEAAALDLFSKILETKDLELNDTRVHYIRLMVPEPQDVGTDEKGVYERVIWFDLCYER